MINQQSDLQNTGLLFWALRVSIVYLLLVLVYPLLVEWLDIRGTPTYVDFADWLAGLAQPLAFAWFVIAVLMQREELRLQRKELELQRNELRLHRNEMEKSNDSVSRQAQAMENYAIAMSRRNFLDFRDDLEVRGRLLLEPFAKRMSWKDNEPFDEMVKSVVGSDGNIYYECVLRRGFSGQASVFLSAYNSLQQMAGEAQIGSWAKDALDVGGLGQLALWLKKHSQGSAAKQD